MTLITKIKTFIFGINLWEMNGLLDWAIITKWERSISPAYSAFVDLILKKTKLPPYLLGFDLNKE
uniref:Uncharacterized protein n=1 Tax=viral metagenome TaxID=1070528 RepID=A0A6M3LIZ0_9ZZZZ